MPDSLKAEAFYDMFREMIALVHSSTNVHEVLELVAWKVTEILRAKGTIVRILNMEQAQLELGAAFGLSEGYLSKGPVTNQKMIEEFYRADRPIVIDDVLHDPRIQYKQEAWDEGIRMMLNLPITLREDLIGIIRVLFTKKRNFSPEELDFLTTLARQCACALERARLFEEERNRYNQLVSQTEKLSALGRMAAGIAHEINNPLSGILLYSSNLRKKVQEPFLKDGLDVIIQETIRCRGIIQDLLEFSRGSEPSMSAADMNGIIDKALGLLQNVFSLNRIKVRKELSPDLPECFVDRNQIEQVFLNLLLNAVEAVQEKGRIIVRSRLDPESNCIRCEVEDNGCGISPQDMPKIFEPFFSTKTKGTGLGLAVTYGIIKNHRGDVKAFSQKGNGTRFVLEIPVREQEPSIAALKGRPDAIN